VARRLRGGTSRRSRRPPARARRAATRAGLSSRSRSYAASASSRSWVTPHSRHNPIRCGAGVGTSAQPTGQDVRRTPRRLGTCPWYRSPRTPTRLAIVPGAASTASPPSCSAGSRRADRPCSRPTRSRPGSSSSSRKANSARGPHGSNLSVESCFGADCSLCRLRPGVMTTSATLGLTFDRTVPPALVTEPGVISSGVSARGSFLVDTSIRSAAASCLCGRRRCTSDGGVGEVVVRSRPSPARCRRAPWPPRAARSCGQGGGRRPGGCRSGTPRPFSDNLRVLGDALVGPAQRGAIRSAPSILMVSPFR